MVALAQVGEIAPMRPVGAFGAEYDPLLQPAELLRWKLAKVAQVVPGIRRRSRHFLTNWRQFSDREGRMALAARGVERPSQHRARTPRVRGLHQARHRSDARAVGARDRVLGADRLVCPQGPGLCRPRRHAAVLRRRRVECGGSSRSCRTTSATSVTACWCSGGCTHAARAATSPTRPRSGSGQ